VPVALCPVAGHHCKESGPVLLTPTLQIFRGISKVPSQPSLLQAKQAQLPQPLLIGEMFQSPHHPRSPPLDSLQQLLIFLELGSPALDTALQMGPHQGSVEGEENLPQPAGHTPPNAPQETIGLLGSQGTLLAHGSLVVPQHSQVPLRRAALCSSLLHVLSTAVPCCRQGTGLCPHPGDSGDIACFTLCPSKTSIGITTTFTLLQT